MTDREQRADVLEEGHELGEVDRLDRKDRGEKIGRVGEPLRLDEPDVEAHRFDRLWRPD